MRGWLLCVLLAIGSTAAAQDGAMDPDLEALDGLREGLTLKPSHPIPSVARRPEISAGVVTTVAHPFVRQHGLAARAVWHQSRWFAFRADGAWFLNLGQSDWTANTKHLVTELAVSPELDTLGGVADVAVEIAPAYGFVRSRGRGVRFGVYGLAGMGVVEVTPDAVSIQCRDLEPCFGAASDLRGSASLGVGTRLWRGQHMFRLELRDRAYLRAEAGASATRLRHHLSASASYGWLMRRR